MKIKCKRCHKKCNVRSPRDVDCTKPDCDVKYNMTDTELAFGNFGEDKLKEITIISDFQSPTPIKIVGTPMSDEEWAKWCLGNIGESSLPPRFPQHYSD